MSLSRTPIHTTSSVSNLRPTSRGLRTQTRLLHRCLCGASALDNRGEAPLWLRNARAAPVPRPLDGQWSKRTQGARLKVEQGGGRTRIEYSDTLAPQVRLDSRGGPLGNGERHDAAQAAPAVVYLTARHVCTWRHSSERPVWLEPGFLFVKAVTMPRGMSKRHTPSRMHASSVEGGNAAGAAPRRCEKCTSVFAPVTKLQRHSECAKEPKIYCPSSWSLQRAMKKISFTCAVVQPALAFMLM